MAGGHVVILSSLLASHVCMLMHVKKHCQDCHLVHQESFSSHQSIKPLKHLSRDASCVSGLDVLCVLFSLFGFQPSLLWPCL